MKPALTTNSLKSAIILQSLILSLLFGLSTKSKAQSLQRQCIASGGTYMLSNGTLIQQTIGQSYGTQTNYDNGISYRPGFQQPVFKILLIHTSLSLIVFPNPAVNSVTIQSTSVIKDALIQVFDISGKLLIRQQIAEMKTFSFNCEGWANGTYMISVSDGQNNTYSSKLLIVR